jgi:hypothetical protein
MASDPLNAGPPQIDPTNIDPLSGYPRLPQGWGWNQFPSAPEFLGDPEWYDTTGRDVLEQRQSSLSQQSTNK